MEKTMSRTLARETTFKLVFEYAFLKQINPLTLEDFLLLEKITEEDKGYIKDSYKGVAENYDNILAIIESNLKNYRLSRIYKTDLAILILAVYEIKFAKHSVPSIIINEAVELSKKYSTDKSFSFVNGILASIIKEEESDYSKILSVTQLNNYLRGIIDAEVMLKNIAVTGEVSGYTIVRGIAYFTLKDEGGLLSCVLFGADNFEVHKVGDKVIVTGSPSYYVKGGKLSFNANKIEAYGLGDLYKKFLQLKEKLEKEGLFDAVYKLQLPKMPKRIGVVTSKTGAVIEDIINVVTRRNNAVDIVLYPVKVQGDKAEYEIAAGIEFFNNYNVDVIIVARGGGSQEDLQPFNTEVVARAIFASKKPVVSAVGHETDFTIADFVADLRAPTPSAAAELVVADYVSEKDKLKSLINRLTLSQVQKVNLLEGLLKNYVNNLSNLVSNLLIKQENKLELLTSGLSRLNPANILIKGYAKLEMEGKLVNSVKDLTVNKEFTARMKDGKIKATVTQIEENS